MAEKQISGSEGLPFLIDGVPPLRQALPLAIQHVVAMIVGCVTPAILVSNAAGLAVEDRVLLIQAALVIAALSTFIQLFPIFGVLGSRLPMIMGVSFAYVPSLVAIAGDYDVATIFGAQIVGGVVAILVGLFVKKLRVLFPPLITGTVVFTIGLSLYPTAVNYMAGGTGNTDAARLATPALLYGSWQNWFVAFITLAIVTLLNHFGKGIWKLASILIGMICGYVVALCFGMVDFSPIAEASVFQLPSLMHFGINFEVSSCVAIGLLFAINSIQAIGDYTATTIGGMDREPTDGELQRGIVAYGASNILGAVLGGLPTATYSQNVGIVVTTKVIKPDCFRDGGRLDFCWPDWCRSFSAIPDDQFPQCVFGRRYHIGIRIDCDDRHEAGDVSADELSEYLDCRLWPRPWAWVCPRRRRPCPSSRIGHDDFLENRRWWWRRLWRLF